MVVVVVVVVLNSNELFVLSLTGRRVVVVEVLVVEGAFVVGAFVVALGFLHSTLRAKSHESAALLKNKPGKL